MGRVISYGEKTGYNDGDYLLLDNGEGGTKRIRADRVGIQLDPTLLDPNKAAPANTVKPIDAAPTQGSSNAVSSGGVKSALDAVTAQIPQIDPTLSQSGQAADAKAVRLQYNDLFEIGNISINNSGWSYDTNWARVRTKKDTTIKLKAGQKIGLTDYTAARFYVGGETLDGEYINTGWTRTDYSAEKDGEYVVLIDTYPSYTDQTTVDGLASLFFAPISALIDYIKSVSDLVYNSIQYVVEKHSGYFSANGGISPASDISKEVYTEKIPVSADDVLTVRLQYLTRRAIWASYVLYDANGYFIGRTVFANLNNTNTTENITITNQSAKYIAFSYRTYGEVQFILCGQKLAGCTQRNLSRIAQNITAETVNRNIKSINHRGFNSIAPENTLPAFMLSRKNGFAIVETDVSFTSDGIAVLLHDDTINRTARNADGSAISSTISISDITYEQALTYDFGIWKNPEYAGTKIPTLTEFLILCKNIGLHPYIELKSNGATEERIAGLVDIVKSVGMTGRVTWISTSNSLLGYIKASDTKARIGYVVGEVSAPYITSALGLKTDSNDVFVDSLSYTQEEINMCKDANLPMEVWTIDSPTGIKNLDPYISGVTSNNLCAGIVLYNSVME